MRRKGMIEKSIEPISVQIMQFIDDFPDLKKQYADLPEEFAFKASQVANHDKSIPQRLAALKALKDTFELMYMDLKKCTDIWEQEQAEKVKDQQRLDESLIGGEVRASVMPSLSDCYRTSVVEAMFDMHRTTIQKYFKDGELIGFQPNGKIRYFPKFQFNKHGAIEGLKAVLKALGNNEEESISFFLSPNVELDNRTPLSALKSGELEAVVHAATIYRDEVLAPADDLPPSFIHPDEGGK